MSSLRRCDRDILGDGAAETLKFVNVDKHQLINSDRRGGLGREEILSEDFSLSCELLDENVMLNREFVLCALADNHTNHNPDHEIWPLEMVVADSDRFSFGEGLYSVKSFVNAARYHKGRTLTGAPENYLSADPISLRQTGERLYDSKITSGSEEDSFSQGKAKPGISVHYSETMDLQEAKETLTNIQYAAITGALNDIVLIERRRFANWALYNPEFRALFHIMNSLTNDVDYNRVF